MYLSDHNLLNIAFEVARASIDERMKVGAVLVHDKERHKIYTACNGFHFSTNREQNDDPEFKGNFVCHAEMNVLMKAVQGANVGGHGWQMYLTHEPCLPCARAITAAGIQNLVYCLDVNDEKNRWQFKEARELLKMCHVEIEQITKQQIQDMTK